MVGRYTLPRNVVSGALIHTFNYNRYHRNTYTVTGHWSNTLDNYCGATITYSCASGASLPLRKRAEEDKQLETV